MHLFVSSYPELTLISSFTAVPSTIKIGESVEICWTLIDPQVNYSFKGGLKRKEGTDSSCKTVSPMETTTFTLNVGFPTFNLSQDSKSVEVIVKSSDLSDGPPKVIEDDNKKMGRNPPTSSAITIPKSVGVKVTIDTDGNVLRISFIDGEESLFSKAKERIKNNWKFRPAIKNGQPIIDDIPVTVNF